MILTQVPQHLFLLEHYDCIYQNKHKLIGYTYISRSVSRTQSNIYGRAPLRKQLTDESESSNDVPTCLAKMTGVISWTQIIIYSTF